MSHRAIFYKVCVVCRVTSRNCADGVRFAKITRQNVDDWLQNNEAYPQRASYYICSTHFLDHEFIPYRNGWKIRPYAVPLEFRDELDPSNRSHDESNAGSIIDSNDSSEQLEPVPMDYDNMSMGTGENDESEIENQSVNQSEENGDLEESEEEAESRNQSEEWLPTGTSSESDESSSHEVEAETEDEADEDDPRREQERREMAIMIKNPKYYFGLNEDYVELIG